MEIARLEARMFQTLSAAAERAGDRSERRVGLPATGAAGLRHVGASAAAFAAQRFRAFLDEIDGRVTCREIGGHADDEAGFAFLRHADDCDDAGAELLLAFVCQALEILDVDTG